MMPSHPEGRHAIVRRRRWGRFVAQRKTPLLPRLKSRAVRRWLLTEGD
jgi:hypothetical protein